MGGPGQWPHFRRAAAALAEPPVGAPVEPLVGAPELVAPEEPLVGAPVALVEPLVGGPVALVEPLVGTLVTQVEPAVGAAMLAQPVGKTICCCSPF